MIMAPPDTDSPGNFPEDYHHENGNYQNFCYSCGSHFIGYKRIVYCKVCDEKSKANWEALTDQQRVDLTAVLKSDIIGFTRKHTTDNRK